MIGTRRDRSSDFSQIWQVMTLLQRSYGEFSAAIVGNLAEMFGVARKATTAYIQYLLDVRAIERTDFGLRIVNAGEAPPMPATSYAISRSVDQAIWTAMRSLPLFRTIEIATPQRDRDMRRRISVLIDFSIWMFSHPVPAVDVGGALIAGGWCLATILAPEFLALPSYRSAAMMPRAVLIIMMASLCLAHVASILRPRLRVWACIAAAGVWSAAAAGFFFAGAWPGLVIYGTLAAGCMLAAIYAEAVLH